MLDNVIEMIRDCLSNLETGCDALYKECASICINILNKHFPILSLDDKDDVVQNTSLKLVRGGLKNFQGTTKYEFLAYFNRVVRNEAYTYLESLKKRENVISIDQGKDCGDDQLPPIEIIDPKPGPDKPLQLKELKRLIEKVLKEFPIKTSQIFVMKREGYKDREISDILGIPMGTVAKQYHQIRQRLQHEITG